MKEKLRADVNRVFSGANPFDFIEDARILETPVRTLCEVVFRVPSPTEAAVNRFYSADKIDALLRGHQVYCAIKQPRRSETEKVMDPVEALKPERIIYSGPKTIVFWPDGTKTIVSLGEGQEHDEYMAYCAAVVKKMFGATHKAKKFLNTVAVRPEPKPKKEPVPEEAEKEDNYADMGLVPMPGTTDPDCGEKQWGDISEAGKEGSNG